MKLRKPVVERRRFTPERPEYYVQTGSMFDNPFGVPHDEIVKMILENDAEVVAQTVFGKYVESSGLVFTGEVIQMLFDRTRERVTGNTWVDRDALRDARVWLDEHYSRTGEYGDRYHGGVDFARQTDYTVISVIDTLPIRFGQPARLVYWRRLNRVPWETIYGEVGRAVSFFGPNFLADDTGPGGDVVFDELESRMYCPEHRRTYLAGDRCTRKGVPNVCDPRKHIALACVEGYTFSGPSKKQLVEHQRNVMSFGYDAEAPDHPFGRLRCPPIVALEEEMSFYTWDDKKLMTDCLFSLALACWSGLEEILGDAYVGSPYGT